MKNYLLLFAAILVGCSTPKEEKDAKSNNSPANIETIAEFEGALPHLYTDLEGGVYLSWVKEQNDTAIFQFSRLEQGSWTTPKEIARGNNWFVNWADYPMVATLRGQNFFAHYLAKSGEGTYSYDVNVRMSNNQGEQWSDAFVLHEDGRQAEHGFVSITPYNDNFLVVWLDGRNTVMENMTEEHEGMEHHGAMSLRASIVDINGQKLQEWQLDDRVCDCCQTGVAVTDNGPIVVYRNRSEEEIRDMYVVRLVNGEWTTPEPLHNDNWKIPGCPVNGPRIATKGNQVAVAWFTASPDPRVNVTFSNDGGITFSQAVRLDHGEAIGRVDVVWTADNQAFVSWMEGADIVGAFVTHDGTIGQPTLIASSNSARSSGFPQITMAGNKIIAAWTDSESGTIKIGWVVR